MHGVPRPYTRWWWSSNGASPMISRPNICTYVHKPLTQFVANELARHLTTAQPLLHLIPCSASSSDSGLCLINVASYTLTMRVGVCYGHSHTHTHDLHPTACAFAWSRASNIAQCNARSVSRPKPRHLRGAHEFAYTTLMTIVFEWTLNARNYFAGE